MAVLLDTGPWVPFSAATAPTTAGQLSSAAPSPPLLICEAVVAETCFLQARSGFHLP